MPLDYPPGDFHLNFTMAYPPGCVTSPQHCGTRALAGQSGIVETDPDG